MVRPFIEMPDKEKKGILQIPGGDSGMPFSIGRKQESVPYLPYGRSF